MAMSVGIVVAVNVTVGVGVDGAGGRGELEGEGVLKGPDTVTAVLEGPITDGAKVFDGIAVGIELIEVAFDILKAITATDP